MSILLDRTKARSPSMSNTKANNEIPPQLLVQAMKNMDVATNVKKEPRKQSSLELPSPPGRSLPSPTSLNFPSPLTTSYESTSQSVNLPPPSSLQHSSLGNYLPPLSSAHLSDSALHAHCAALQHEVSVQISRPSKASMTNCSLPFSRSRTRASVLEKKHAVSDSEIISLTEEKLRLQAQVIELEQTWKSCHGAEMISGRFYHGKEHSMSKLSGGLVG